ncbi:MAG: hypothetical protein F4W95_04260 [Chloroflexi bacterium]|nr:hypothetical protein [Chloroflexota bacterium]MYD47685.1 hypothetical protein [Chloroflexota bacterium]
MWRWLNKMISPTSGAIYVTAALTVTAWLVSDCQDRQYQLDQWKTERYHALVESARGFHAGADPSSSWELREEFITQLDLCWVYCSDAVIRKAYRFVGTVKTGQTSTDEEKKRAFKEFIAEIRKEIVRDKSTLTWEEFRILSATK